MRQDTIGCRHAHHWIRISSAAGHGTWAKRYNVEARGLFREWEIESNPVDHVAQDVRYFWVILGHFRSLVPSPMATVIPEVVISLVEYYILSLSVCPKK